MKKFIAPLALALGLAAFIGGTVQSADARQQPQTPKKVYVCKYVGTPGVDERLQEGGNPIEVSANAIDGDLEYPDGVGMEFADQQGRSIVIGWVGTDAVPLPVLTIEDCPAPDVPEECPEGTHRDPDTGECVPHEEPETRFVCNEDGEIIEIPAEDYLNNPLFDHETTPPNDPNGHCSGGPDDPDPDPDPDPEDPEDPAGAPRAPQQFSGPVPHTT